jgi:hypothetical protein
MGTLPTPHPSRLPVLGHDSDRSSPHAREAVLSLRFRKKIALRDDFVCGLGYYILEQVCVGMCEISGDFEIKNRGLCTPVVSISSSY